MIVIGTLLLGLTAWLVLVPATVYLERGPRGRKTSCGSVIQAREPYATGDEVCVDALDARRRAAPITGTAGGILVLLATLGRAVRRSWIRRAPGGTVSKADADRMQELQVQSYRSLRQRAGRGPD